MKRTIIETADGSKTLSINNDSETYHSRHGAVQESAHVFIEAGLQQLAQKTSTIRVLEVGMGTGLNVLLSLRFAREHSLAIHYVALEPYPLNEDEWQALDYASNDEEWEWFKRIHHAPQSGENAIAKELDLACLKKGLLEADLHADSFDVIYYDAFGPNTQPELWGLPCFERCFAALAEGGVLVTYCAKGQVRRDMQSAGFEVERLPGPPGKREMLRAWKK